MKQRIFKSYITTLLGLAIIAAAIFRIIKMESATWTNAAIGITIGLYLIYVDEAKITKWLENKKI